MRHGATWCERKQGETEKRAYKRRKRLESAELTNRKSAQTLQENLEKNIPEVMGPRLAAEYMSVHVSTIYRYLACGILKAAQATAKHRLEVAAPINAVIRDTVLIRDTVQVVQQKVEMTSPHIQLDAVIDNDTLRGDIRLPVTLQQTVWVEYKRKCLFWKKVKVIHQTISSDNPYVDIKYSEYRQIDKKYSRPSKGCRFCSPIKFCTADTTQEGKSRNPLQARPTISVRQDAFVNLRKFVAQ